MVIKTFLSVAVAVGGIKQKTAEWQGGTPQRIVKKPAD